MGLLILSGTDADHADADGLEFLNYRVGQVIPMPLLHEWRSNSVLAAPSARRDQDITNFEL
jgi:hypothetical protein